MRTLGNLVKWDAERGFGFIRCRDNGVEVFVHITAFPRGGRQPQIGDALSFEITTADDGRKRAKAVVHDVPMGRAKFSLEPIERPVADRAAHTTPARASAPRPDRSRGRNPHRESPGGLSTLIFAALLIGGGVFGYRKFLEYRAVAVDSLYGQSAQTTVAPSSTSPSSTLSPVSPRVAAPAYQCDGRTRCGQMHSCADATQVLQNCPGTEMDGDGDGIPCEQQWCH